MGARAIAAAAAGERAREFFGLEPHTYRAIYADPPWRYKQWDGNNAVAAMANRKGVARKHYDTLSAAELSAMPVRDLAAPGGCHLFMWVTGPNLPAGLEVMRAWGFKYSALAFSWLKLKRAHMQLSLFPAPLDDREFHLGLGHTTRHNAELVLLGRRGSPRRLEKDVRELVLEPVREHSRKPDEVAWRIERYCDGPYLELFARARRPGWTVWGDQADRFTAGVDLISSPIGAPPEEARFAAAPPQNPPNPEASP